VNRCDSLTVVIDSSVAPNGRIGVDDVSVGIDGVSRRSRDSDCTSPITLGARSHHLPVGQVFSPRRATEQGAPAGSAHRTSGRSHSGGSAPWPGSDTSRRDGRHTLSAEQSRRDLPLARRQLGSAGIARCAAVSMRGASAARCLDLRCNSPEVPGELAVPVESCA